MEFLDQIIFNSLSPAINVLIERIKFVEENPEEFDQCITPVHIL